MKKDVQSLEKSFTVITFNFKPSPKWLTPFRFIQQAFFLLWHLPSARAQISLFAGYHSFLPSVLGRIFSKKSIIILGGTDCASFPSINYGNFNKRVQGLFTRWSIQLADHLAPVDISLVSSEYYYTNNDSQNQGYTHYCSGNLPPYTVIHFGYDSNLFKRSTSIKEDSFLTVGFLNPANYYRKGIDLVFDQAQRRPNSTYTIIGGTKQDLPEGIEVPKNVSLVASVSYEELVAYYSAHQFYFQLSMMEGFPSAICESMLCECIPIGSEVAAIPTIIGDTGYLLKHKNGDQLHALVNQAIQEASPEKALKARKRIMDYYPKDERDKIIDLVRSHISD